MGGMLAWVACSLGGVDGVLAWVACLRGWRASMGGLGGVLTCGHLLLLLLLLLKYYPEEKNVKC